jgi:hypothetical protein
MGFVFALEILFITTVIIVGISQLVIPLLTNRPLFPFFRRASKIRGEIVEARGDIDAAELEREMIALRKQADDLYRLLREEQDAEVRPSPGFTGDK